MLELKHIEGWALKNWCFWTVGLEKILESPLDCKEIQLVHLKGNQFWIFIGRNDAEAPILWPADVENWLTGKDPDIRKDIRWIIKKAREFQKNIYLCFIDYAKAFDCVDHKKLWKILKEIEYQTTWPQNGLKI